MFLCLRYLFASILRQSNLAFDVLGMIAFCSIVKVILIHPIVILLSQVWLELWNCPSIFVWPKLVSESVISSEICGEGCSQIQLNGLGSSLPTSLADDHPLCVGAPNAGLPLNLLAELND